VEADEVQDYRVWWDDANGITRLGWVAGSACTLPKAQGILEAVAALGHGRVRILVDIRQSGSIDRPARELFMYSEEYFESFALLAGSAATRMMANFFLGLNRGPIPVRMFTSEAEAVGWLRAQS
jgi:hypothetical protein